MGLDVSEHSIKISHTLGRTTYLDYHANQYVTLIFPLLAGAVPPQLRTPQPELWSADATAVALVHRLVVYTMEESMLLGAYDQQLLVLCLVKADSNRQVTVNR